MPKPSVRSLAQRALRAFVWLSLVTVVVFFALTRTQVGREGLRGQIEREVAQRYEGSLEIGRLDGNLVNDLYASDVRLYDDNGRLVLAVDSVVARPRWRALLGRRFDARSIQLIRPAVHLHQREDESWTLANALRRDPASRTNAVAAENDGPALSVVLATVRVVDGSLLVTSDAPPPDLVERGVLFDYRGAQVEDFDAVFTVEPESDERRLIDLLSLSLDAPALGFAVEELRGQVTLEGDGVSVAAASMTTGSSEIALSGFYRSRSEQQSPALQVTLEADAIDFDEWAIFFPSIPLASKAGFTLRANGPLDDLVVELAEVRSGRARASVSGVVAGLPETADFDMQVRGSWVRSDVAAILPGLGLPEGWRADTATVALDIDGGLVGLRDSTGTSGAIRARGSISMPSAGGAMFSAEASRSAGTAVRYEARVQSQDLRAERVLRRLPSSFLTIETAASGRLGSRPSHSIQLIRAEGDLAGRSFSEASGQAVLGAGVASANLSLALAEDGGLIEAEAAAVGLGTAEVTHTAQVDAASLDIARLFPGLALSSNLTGGLKWEGAGSSIADFSGIASVSVAASEFASESGAVSQLPPHVAVVDVETGATPSVRISGDVLSGQLSLTRPLEDTRALTAQWGAEVRSEVSALFRKPIAQDTLSGALPPAALQSPALQSSRNAANSDVPEEFASARLRVLRSDILAAYRPGTSQIGTDIEVTAVALADTSAMNVSLSIQGDSLILPAMPEADGADAESSVAKEPRLRAHGFEANIDLNLDRFAATRERRGIVLSVAADSMRASGQTLFAPAVDASLRGPAGSISVSTATPPGQPSPPVIAEGSIFADFLRNRIVFDRLEVRTGIYDWRQRERADVTLYADAIRFASLILEARLDQEAPTLDSARDLPQRFALSGIASGRASDTLLVDFERVALRPLVGLSGFRREVGGRLDAEVAVAAALGEAEVAGNVFAQSLSIDDVVLGDVRIRTDYVPGQPALALDLDIAPPALEAAPDTPGRPLITNTRLRADGTLSLSDGSIDLAVESPGLDPQILLLFFPVIGEAEGAARASGTISGTFRKPAFDLAIQTDETLITIPRFGLRYSLSADLQGVGTEGIRIREARLRDPRGGSGTLGGWLRFNDYRFFSFDIAGSLDRMQVMNKDRPEDLAFYGDLAASGSLTLTGPTFDTLLRSPDAVVTPESELFIPISDVDEAETDRGFVIFADSSGALPDVESFVRRRNVVAQRPEGERSFAEALRLDLNISAPPGATVGLVFDELLGDVLRAQGSGRVQLQRSQGNFDVFGTFNVDGGDYLFTAGDVFAREFEIQEGGSMTWDGNPLNAALSIPATYRTRASRAGLPSFGGDQTGLIPVVVQLGIGGRVLAPEVDLSLAVDRSDRQEIGSYEEVEVYLNNPDRATEYATSVLLTNTFLLTPSEFSGETALASSGTITFSSLSALVSSQLTRILSEAVPNLDVRLGVQQGDRLNQLDLTGDLALFLLDDRLVIRGQGVVSQNDPTRTQQQQGLEGEIAVEVRLTEAVAVEVFFRREGDVIADALTSTRGAGVTYQTRFTTWGKLLRRIFGDEGEEEGPSPAVMVPQREVLRPSDTSTDTTRVLPPY